MMHTTTWLIANWKMYGTRARVQSFAYGMNAALAAAPASIRGVFCPPFTYLDAAHAALPQNAQLAIGGQNCARDAEGAFTGGISAPMLKDCSARYVIIGHSERRQFMHETDDQVVAKVAAAMAAGLTPIVCVGETAQEYEAQKTTSVLEAQLTPLAAALGAGALVAYEPVWAIGTGKTPSLDEIQVAHTHIKSILGSTQPVLYGGSVKPANIREILAIASVSGALIGSASLKLEDMSAMIAAVS